MNRTKYGFSTIGFTNQNLLSEDISRQNQTQAILLANAGIKVIEVDLFTPSIYNDDITRKEFRSLSKKSDFYFRINSKYSLTLQDRLWMIEMSAKGISVPYSTNAEKISAHQLPFSVNVELMERTISNLSNISKRHRFIMNLEDSILTNVATYLNQIKSKKVEYITIPSVDEMLQICDSKGYGLKAIAKKFDVPIITRRKILTQEEFEDEKRKLEELIK